jgi:nucleotide-binding universal stress UspA family protein
MSTDTDIAHYSAAVSDFRRARNQADLKDLLARLTGESTQLLSYDEARHKLILRGFTERGLQDIPLESIVGSVGRYSDFTRDFLPRHEVSEERWARVKAVAEGMKGYPPIEVYKIGEVYFVKDGNHRVSVARAMGSEYIQAYITEVQTRVPLSQNDNPDDLIIKGEYANFLEETHLGELRPEANLQVTAPGQYPILIEHIDVHQYFMGIDQKRHIPYGEAVANWYDNVYQPVVDIIHRQGILRDFPGRTETDLYLWIAEHRASLAEQLGWDLKTEDIAAYLSEHHRSSKKNVINKVKAKILDVIIPEKLESGPPTGEWRTKSLSVRPDDRLILDVLAPVNGKEDGWCGLEQALVLARKEGASLRGLYILPDDESIHSESTHQVETEFTRRCAQAGVTARLIKTAGEVVEEICMRASWTDIVVVNLSYPPGDQPLARLSSGFRDLLQRSPRPVLAAPQVVSQLNRALLAYDGSAKSQEALFVATYLAGRWGIALTVLTVVENGLMTEQVSRQAREYLEKHGVEAEYQIKKGPPQNAILETAQSQECDFLIIGSYGYSPVLELFLGSTVDHLLRESPIPMLICR